MSQVAEDAIPEIIQPFAPKMWEVSISLDHGQRTYRIPVAAPDCSSAAALLCRHVGLPWELFKTLEVGDQLSADWNATWLSDIMVHVGIMVRPLAFVGAP